MLRTHFIALVVGFVLLAVAVVTGHQLFGEPIESAPMVPVLEQQLAPEGEDAPALAIA
jgi:hypothetical protein